MAQRTLERMEPARQAQPQSKAAPAPRAGNIRGEIILALGGQGDGGHVADLGRGDFAGEGIMSAEVKKCKATMWSGWHRVNCSRKASMGDYCGIHHPDKVKARKDKQAAKWETRASIIRNTWEKEAKRNEHRDFCEKNYDALFAILTELRAELDDYSDVIDNPEGGSPRPNVEMRLMQFLDQKLAELKL
jgi:hypothetical protein